MIVVRKKKKGGVIPEETLVTEMSVDDLMKISQKRNNIDSEQKTKKPNKEVPVSAEPESGNSVLRLGEIVGEFFPDLL